MTRSIFIPKGMKAIDALAVMVPNARQTVEMEELQRLHDIAMEKLDPSIKSLIPARNGRWTRDVLNGNIRLPIRGDALHLTSSLWGSMNLADLSDPKKYEGNVGYINFTRDSSVIVGGEHVFNYPHPYEYIPQHFGGQKRMVADWRKSLYLLLLAESEEYIEQFKGPVGLDDYARRYFLGNVSKARSFAINILSESIYETLEWKTSRSARARTAYQDRQRETHKNDYKRVLSWARNLHEYEPSLSLRAFVQRLLRMDDDHRKRPAAARVGSSFCRFGKMYWSWVDAGVDTKGLDSIFSHHGLGYHEAPALYAKFVSLARDKGFSTEQLSRIAVKRGIINEPVGIAYSPSGYKILLDVFYDYGIETDDLAPLLRENAPAYIGGRINEWIAMPGSRRGLFVHLGITTLEYESFYKWVRRYVGQAQAQIVDEEYRRTTANNR